MVVHKKKCSDTLPTVGTCPPNILSVEPGSMLSLFIYCRRRTYRRLIPTHLSRSSGVLFCVCNSPADVHSSPRTSYRDYPMLSLEVATPENKSIHSTLSFHIHERPPQKRFLVGCSSPFKRLAQHLTALRAWCKQYLPGR